MKKAKIVIIVLLVVLVLALIGVGGFFLFKEYQDVNKKLDDVSNQMNAINNENSIVNENKVSNTSTNIATNTTSGSVSEYHNEVVKAISAELKSSDFVTKNGGASDSIVKFAQITNNTYLVHVYNKKADENGNYSFYLFVSYKNGAVTVEKDYEHKYDFEMYYDLSKGMVKGVLEYKGQKRTEYAHVVDGKLNNKTSTFEPAEGYDLSYTINGEKKSKEDYTSEKAKLDNYNWVKFSSSAVELNSANVDKIVK